MNALSLEEAKEAVYTSLQNDNEDIDLHILALKSAMQAEGRTQPRVNQATALAIHVSPPKSLAVGPLPRWKSTRALAVGTMVIATSIETRIDAETAMATSEWHCITSSDKKLLMRKSCPVNPELYSNSMSTLRASLPDSTSWSQLRMVEDRRGL